VHPACTLSGVPEPRRQPPPAIDPEREAILDELALLLLNVAREQLKRERAQEAAESARARSVSEQR
jgi:hypothetical protein